MVAGQVGMQMARYVYSHSCKNTDVHNPELIVGREEGLEESDPKGTKAVVSAVSPRESDRRTAKGNASKV